MKTSTFVAAFAALATLSFLVPASASQCGPSTRCSDKASLVISGSVPAICNIEMQAKAAATALNVLAGESSKSIANVVEQSNVPAGYTVSVSSLNNGKLKHNSVASELVSYQLSYDGGANFSPSSAAAIVKNSGPLSGFTTDNSDLKITFPAKPTAMVGVYSDTLSFTIQSL